MSTRRSFPSSNCYSFYFQTTMCFVCFPSQNKNSNSNRKWSSTFCACSQRVWGYHKRGNFSSCTFYEFFFHSLLFPISHFFFSSSLLCVLFFFILVSLLLLLLLCCCCFLLFLSTHISFLFFFSSKISIFLSSSFAVPSSPRRRLSIAFFQEWTTVRGSCVSLQQRRKKNMLKVH